MKKFIPFVAASFILFLCNFSIDAQTKDHGEGNFNGSFHKGNYVWGGAMNLCWNELSENIIKEKVKLITDDEAALEMLRKLNSSEFSKNDLNEDSYYIKSGYGPKTIEQINKECRVKFPTKNFSDLKYDLGPADIISYAYFLKEVEYAVQFQEKTVLFNDERVNGFYTANTEQEMNIRILEYDNKNKFIISLQLKNNSDELILAKGYDVSSPKKITDKLNTLDFKDFENMHPGDMFEMPKIHLIYHRDYEEMLGKKIGNTDFGGYIIGEMFENIKFDMDHKGARVENEAVVLAYFTGGPGTSKVKRLILDKPFWVIMKQSTGKRPYFLLGVANTELMVKE